MTEEQRENKLNYLREQKLNPTGNYRKYLVNLYNYYREKANENNCDWCISKFSEMISAAYEENPDHMAYSQVRDYSKTLSELGYIQKKNVNGQWRVYILKELDF